jgi:hypothetical protein
MAGMGASKTGPRDGGGLLGWVDAQLGEDVAAERGTASAPA